MFSPSIVCNVKLNKNDNFIFGIIYRSPNCTEDESTNVNKLISLISDKHCKEQVTIVGDFNYRDINWKDDKCDKAENHKASKFLECIHKNYLHQLILEPTHHRGTQTPSLIDLILTNDSEFIQDIEFHPPVGKSHHSVICFNLNVTLTHKFKESVRKFKLDKGDYKGMREHINAIDWDVVMDEDKSLNEWGALLTDSLDNAKVLYIPQKLCKQNLTKRKFAAPASMLEALDLKRKSFKNFKKYPTTANNEVYIYYRNLVNKEVKQAKRNKELKVAKEAKFNPKALYQFFASMNKPKESVPNLEKQDGTLTETDEEKANLLSDFFKSVYTVEDDTPLPDFKVNVKSKISSVDFTVEDIKTALKSLNVNKSQGPDGVHPRVLKELADQIAYPLFKLFSRSIKEGKVPDKWKEAEVRPIFKKGKKTSPGNYRPVSLTSILCKMLEGFVRSTLYKHLIDNDLLSLHQFGFCKGRSCLTQLLVTIHDWMSYLDENIPVDVAYLDFRKAFDSVPHKRLIHKLNGYGVEGNLLHWITDFLSERTQFVSINDCKSEKVPVTSGVPQGSVLGPTLFIYFINDLPTVSDSTSKIFADDTKGYNPIHSPEDQVKQQSCIDAFVEWSIKWLLGFNFDKCNIMHLGKNNPHYQYTINNGTDRVVLKTTHCEKDLGVYIDPLLNFQEHITTTVKKARSLTGLILRSVTGRTGDILLPLFIALVRPILEYANPVWCPMYKKDIERIEKVQRHFTKRICGLNKLSYPERLKELNLPSLEYRRARGDMIETYKMTHDIYDNLTTNSLITQNNNSITRSNTNKLFKQRFNTKQFQHFFSNRIINNWNSLPEEIVNCKTLNSFKNGLDRYWGGYKFSINIRNASRVDDLETER